MAKMPIFFFILMFHKIRLSSTKVYFNYPRTFMNIGDKFMKKGR